LEVELEVELMGWIGDLDLAE